MTTSKEFYNLITSAVKERTNFDTMNEVGRISIDTTNHNIIDAINKINTDKRLNYYIYLSSKENELVYELDDYKKKLCSDINNVINDIESLLTDLKFIRDNKLVAKCEISDHTYSVESIDNKTEIEFDLISYLKR